jgi:Chalcone isomerase-like
MTRFTFAFIFLCVSVMSTAHAARVAGHDLPDTWKLGEQTLVLNGAGVREYSFLKIHVYVAALYLAEREANQDAILQSIKPRVLHMKMLRDVSREDSGKAWRHYLNENCKAPCVLDPSALKTFEALVPETKTNDTQTYVFANTKLEIFRNGMKLGEVPNASFANTVLSTWIGAVPTTESLKRALLGAKAASAKDAY